MLAIFGGRMLTGKVLEQKLVAAFETWAKDDINKDYWDEQFKDMDRWEYGRPTRRKNKKLVDSPRDIYDLGRLYDSGVESFNVDLGSSLVVASWKWDAVGNSGYHYAHDVHEGKGTSDGNPRRWTDELAFPDKFYDSQAKKVLIARIKMAMAK